MIEYCCKGFQKAVEYDDFVTTRLRKIPIIQSLTKDTQDDLYPQSRNEHNFKELVLRKQLKKNTRLKD
jgi:hypothetical protein